MIFKILTALLLLLSLAIVIPNIAGMLKEAVKCFKEGDKKFGELFLVLTLVATASFIAAVIVFWVLVFHLYGGGI